MAKVKSYTDLSQSKVLAEILPIDSADMYYSDVLVREWVDKTDISKGTHMVFKSQIFAIENLHNRELEIGEYDVYAWSLAALLEATSKAIVMNKVEGNTKYIFSSSRIGTYTTADNPIDACYKMIVRLHELDLL